MNLIWKVPANSMLETVFNTSFPNYIHIFFGSNSSNAVISLQNFEGGGKQSLVQFQSGRTLAGPCWAGLARFSLARRR